MNNEITVNFEKTKQDNFGDIITDGKFIENFKHNLSKDLPDDAINSIINNAIETLNYCPNPQHIGEFKKTGLMIGKVQSGKTSNFIALLALAFDNGYNIGVVIGGNTIDLLDQNTERLKSSLNLGKQTLLILQTKQNENLLNPTSIKRFLQQKRKIIIVSLKSPQEKYEKHMSIVSKLFDDPILKKQTTLIIDDEGDQATLNSRANSKDLEKQVSSTYKVAIELKDKIDRNCFISVTATPQANLLIALDNVLSPDFCTLIKPGIGYSGLETFHGTKINRYIKEVPDNEDLLVDPKAGVPDSFRDALAAFYVSNAIKKYRFGNVEHSMLIHPSVKMDFHESVASKVDDLIVLWQQIVDSGKNDIAYTSGLKNRLVKAYDMFKEGGSELPPFDEIEDDILDSITMSSNTLIFNSEHHNSKADAEMFNTRIYLGGTLLDRGITIPGLTITYIVRRAKSTANVDNTEQRARWFGYRKGYLDLCRVWATQPIIDDFYSIYESDNYMWKVIEDNLKQGLPFKELKRVFLLDSDSTHRLRLTRKSVANTESIVATKWLTQFHINDAKSAKFNYDLLEKLKNKLTGMYEKDFGGVNVHLWAENVDSNWLFENMLSEYITQDKNISIELLKGIFVIAKEKSLDTTLDVVWVRHKTNEERTIEENGKVSNLYRGHDLKADENGDFKYRGDQYLFEERPDKCQLQIHYVIPKNPELEKTIYPTIGFYRPEVYRYSFERQKDD